MKLLSLLFFLFLTMSCSETKQAAQTPAPKKMKNAPYLLLTENEAGDMGYINPKGDTVIALGKYSYCFTDTFRTYAIVTSNEGFIAINQQEEKLFKVMMYDNGPDYVEEGLFRIMKDDKIGYANTKGEIVIAPKYACAYPFKDGKAKVAIACKITKEMEHSVWESETWFWIDKTGKKLD